MASGGGHTMYPECKDFPRSRFEDSAGVQAFALSQNKGVLPLFEKIMSDYKQMKMLSLETNELLKCRWRSYIQNIDKKTFEPYKFPGSDELHIHNCEIKIMPSLSPKNRPNLRMQMGTGPGVDTYGQMPIPNDMHVCKSNINKNVGTKKGKHH